MFQQVVYSTDFGFGRVTHRVRFEERFIHDKAPEQEFMGTRLRYQIGITVPFRRTDEVNDGEFYLNANNEFYFSTSGYRNALYNEKLDLSAGIGYQTAGRGRFEIGPLIQRVVVDKQHDVRYFELMQFSWFL